jgi:hypothetical protein
MKLPTVRENSTQQIPYKFRLPAHRGASWFSDLRSA